ncbi:apolipoprotein N-acyltransferase [uncultured Nocardioides sp.]|uniref:apolipoprotein N-acyltransferase n=1 Tax=uncultured Nocardioides sp. TaxID=198441 RepID=UPI0026247858|nr:apolipoprotein N-acyltransferase [uncultured Nocardioides sp.]
MQPAPATSARVRSAEAGTTAASLTRQPGRRTLLARPPAAALAGFAAAGASAPWEQRWLLPLAVAALVLLLRRVSVRYAVVLGLLFGLAYTLALTSWMRAVGTDAWLLLSPVVAAYYAVAAVAIALVGRLRGWPWWTACVWVAVEAAMSSWPLGGFPWTRLAWATVDTPFALWLPWIGATGVSFLVALAGATLAWVLHEGKARPAGAAAAIVAALLVGAVPALFRPESLTSSWETGRPTVTVAAVQGDVPGAGNDLVAVHEQVTANHVQATLDLARRVEAGAAPQPDFVLWPENSTAVDPFRDEETNAGISRAVAAIDVPLLVGAIVDGPRPDAVLNQGLVWLPDGSTDERYTKRHPVPFGEYVPFRSQLAGLQIGRLDMIPRDMIAGARSRPLNVAGTRVVDLICFDVAYDDSLIAQVQNGGQMVTVQTSNATFTGTSQQQQQFTISRARAMETGRTVIVASTNGISGVIAPDGTVRQQLEPRTTDIAVTEVALVDSQTPAVRHGSLIKLVLCLMGVAAAITAAVRSSRRQFPLRGHHLKSWRTPRERVDT